jgi:hypothetical protein
MARIEPKKSRGGKWVTFGDDEYRMPPLALQSIIDLEEDFTIAAGVVGMPNQNQLDSIFKIVHAALKRNYPDVPLEEMREMLDVQNTFVALDAVMAASGFVRGESQGEPQASTGTSSS